MQSTWHPAPASLHRVLVGIWSVRADCEGELLARVLPDGTTCLVFQHDESTLRSSDDDWRLWSPMSVSGPRTGPFDFRLSASGRLFIVQLAAEGAQSVLGVPMASLTDRFEPLELVSPLPPGDVVDKVLGAVDEHACVHSIERWVLSRVRMSASRCALTDAAVSMVTHSAGNARIDAVASRLGISRRHLGRLMLNRVGISPKLFARITRFQRAIELGRYAPAMSWAKIALDAGYADQAHMSRDFAALGSISPNQLRGEQAAMLW